MSTVWTISHLLLWAIVLVQTVVILALTRQIGSLLLRVGSSKAFEGGIGPPIGAPGPPVDGIVLDERRTLLAFVSTDCGTCSSLVPALNAVGRAYRSRLRVVGFAREDQDSLAVWGKETHFGGALVSSPDAFAAYSVQGTPFCFVLDPEGRVISKGGVNHLDQVEELLRPCDLLPEPDAEGPVDLEEVIV